MTSMYIVTDTKTTTDADPEKEGALIAVHIHDCTIQRRQEDIDPMFERKRLGDDRLAGLRVFELKIGDDGTPKIGKEVKAG